MQENCGVVGTRNGSRSLASALFQDIADRHLGAGFDHQPRGLGADAARRAGHQCDLAIETVH